MSEAIPAIGEAKYAKDTHAMPGEKFEALGGLHRTTLHQQGHQPFVYQIPDSKDTIKIEISPM